MAKSKKEYVFRQASAAVQSALAGCSPRIIKLVDALADLLEEQFLVNLLTDPSAAPNDLECYRALYRRLTLKLGVTGLHRMFFDRKLRELQVIPGIVCFASRQEMLSTRVQLLDQVGTQQIEDESSSQGSKIVLDIHMSGMIDFGTILFCAETLSIADTTHYPVRFDIKDVGEVIIMVKGSQIVPVLD